MRLLRTLLPAVLLVVFSTCARAQEAEGDVTLRFQVAGVSAPELAKPLQVELLGRPGVNGRAYIDACQCFKLSVAQPLDRPTLEQWLADLGHELAGTVVLSNGETWPQPTPAPWPK